MQFRFHIWGDRACFARPEFTRDRVSYDVITPFAARAILDAIYRPPAIRWYIDSIHVLNPIRTQQVAQPQGEADAAVQIDLLNVSYVLEAHFELTDRAGPDDHGSQHASLVKRNASRNLPHRRPFLGIEPYPAQFRLLADDEAIPPSQLRETLVDLGWMVHDLDESRPARLRFYRPIMSSGVIVASGNWRTDLPA